MKNRFGVYFGLLMVAALLAHSGWAQSTQNHAALATDNGAETAKIVADVLLLEPDRTDKVVQAFTKSATDIQIQIKEEKKDWRTLTPDQRREATQKVLQQEADIQSNNLKGILTDAESATIQPVLKEMSVRRAAASRMLVELEALRTMGLKPEQVDALRPSAQAYSLALLGATSPADKTQTAKNSIAEVQSLHKAFAEKAEAVLTPEQKQTWINKTKELKVASVNNAKAKREERKTEAKSVKQTKTVTKQIKKSV